MRVSSVSAGAREGRDPVRASGERSAVRYHRLVQHVHALGPRPLGELLLQVAADRDALLDQLEVLAAWDSAVIRWFGADDWYRLPLRSVT